MSELLTHPNQSVVADYDRLRDDCGMIELAEISLVTLKGDDRKGWLQGQVTNNVRLLESGASSMFCFCEPTGHLLAICEAWALSDRIVMTTAKATEEALLRRIEQMVVMEDVRAESSAETHRMISVQGPRATAELGRLVSLPSLDSGEAQLGESSVYCLRSNRTGMGGWDVWVPADQAKALGILRDAFAPIAWEAYDIARLEAGIPSYGRDATAKTMPPELGGFFSSRHINYNKGCYVGQEVLMRMHSRGHTNRTWMGLISEQPMEVGATVAHPRRPDAGLITSAIYSPDFGNIGAAMLRNEAASDGETVIVKTSGGDIEAEVRPMPLLRFD
jgi:folate-binding protein YgfZ